MAVAELTSTRDDPPTDARSEDLAYICEVVFTGSPIGGTFPAIALLNAGREDRAEGVPSADSVPEQTKPTNGLFLRQRVRTFESQPIPVLVFAACRADDLTQSRFLF